MHKTTITILLAVLLLVIAETGFQARMYLRSGESIFTRVVSTPMYVRHPESGLLLLRPSSVIKGTNATITSNSLGLRSPEIGAIPEPNVYRIAVVGASTVMGAFAARNEDTFPYILQKILSEQHPKWNYEVINAGMPGYSISTQRKLVEHVIAGLHPDLVVLYPGLNDISGYCRDRKGPLNSRPTAKPLPQIKLPRWLSSIDLLLKNTVFLRDVPYRQPNQKRVSDIDTQIYRENFDALRDSILDKGFKLLIMTVARAYRRDMPANEQMRLSAMARYYNECFDLTALHDVADLHNEIIASSALIRNVPVLRTDLDLPGGSEYFGDANHFSAEGERLVAELLAKLILEKRLIP